MVKIRVRVCFTYNASNLLHTLHINKIIIFIAYMQPVGRLRMTCDDTKSAVN